MFYLSFHFDKSAGKEVACQIFKWVPSGMKAWTVFSRAWKQAVLQRSTKCASLPTSLKSETLVWGPRILVDCFSKAFSPLTSWACFPTVRRLSHRIKADELQVRIREEGGWPRHLLTALRHWGHTGQWEECRVDTRWICMRSHAGSKGKVLLGEEEVAPVRPGGCGGPKLEMKRVSVELLVVASIVWMVQPLSLVPPGQSLTVRWQNQRGFLACAYLNFSKCPVCFPLFHSLAQTSISSTSRFLILCDVSVAQKRDV